MVSTAGAAFVAFDLSAWVPVLLAVVALIEFFVTFFQLEKQILSYNAAAGSLQKLLHWWEGLDLMQQQLRQNKDRLVNDAEKAILQKHEGFVLLAISSKAVEDDESAQGGKSKRKKE